MSAEHFRYTRFDTILQGHDGTLAEHHDEPCLVCKLDFLEDVAKAAEEDHPTWVSETGIKVCSKRNEPIECCPVCRALEAAP